jgi:hypothetical protein
MEMPVFPSTDWMDAYCEELAAHPDAAATAEALDGVYRFVVEPDGPLPDRQSFDVLIAPVPGGAQVQRVEDAEQPRLALSARYGRWRQLIEGELDIGMALVLRRLRVSGDVRTLRTRLGDAGPLTDALRRVDTQWLA